MMMMMITASDVEVTGNKRCR